MDAIILTEAQAAMVQGEYEGGHYLKPYKLRDRWILPASVLLSPHYEGAKNVLLQCPIETIEMPKEEDPI